MKTKYCLPQKNGCSQNKKRFILTLPTALCLMLIALLHYSVSVFAGIATFTLLDETGLPTGPSGHKIYVAGWSATPGYYLSSNSSGGIWVPLPQQAAGQIPCYELGNGPDQISQTVIDPSQYSPIPGLALSARIYFFIDVDGTYPPCNNGTTSATTGINGIFGTANFSYTFTASRTTPPGTFAVQGITQTSIGAPGTGVPMYSFGEIGPGPSFGTIDTSQVDLFAFPVTIQASVQPANPPIPGNPPIVGNTLGTGPNNLNTISFSDNAIFTAYMTNLAGPAGCPPPPTPLSASSPPSCAYLRDLVYPYGNYSALLNPGGFLNTANTSANNSLLQHAFDTVIGQFWEAPGKTIKINNGIPTAGYQPGCLDDCALGETFTGTFTPSMTYPCNSTGTGCPQTTAIKFVDNDPNGGAYGYTFYIFNPIAYEAGCVAGTITLCGAGSIYSRGAQVFGGSGVFIRDEYDKLTAMQGLPPATTSQGKGQYTTMVKRMGVILTQAMNRGVASMDCPDADTWKCWNLQTNWYPNDPNINQNLFARFLHTATNMLGTPFFLQPPDFVQSAASLPMGMAYGFSNDENSTPVVPPPSLNISPEVPSKMDGTVLYGGPGPYTITLGPWSSFEDCVFNWFEAKYPQYLTPTDPPTYPPTQYGVINNIYYAYRSYDSGWSLGYYTLDGHMYYKTTSTGPWVDFGGYGTTWGYPCK